MTFPINLTLSYYIETLLFSRDVNIARQYYVNNEVDTVTPCLT